jgi:hypothetical protein
MMAAESDMSSALWPIWLMLIVFSFISFESILLAFALKGSWFVLVAPGAVCGVKAYDTWKILQRQSRMAVERALKNQRP